MESILSSAAGEEWFTFIEGNDIAIVSRYDTKGREIAKLLDSQIEEGNHSVTWNSTGSPSGIYFYRLKSGGQVLSKKMLLLK